MQRKATADRRRRGWSGRSPPARRACRVAPLGGAPGRCPAGRPGRPERPARPVRAARTDQPAARTRRRCPEILPAAQRPTRRCRYPIPGRWWWPIRAPHLRPAPVRSRGGPRRDSRHDRRSRCPADAARCPPAVLGRRGRSVRPPAAIARRPASVRPAPPGRPTFGPHRHPRNGAPAHRSHRADRSVTRVPTTRSCALPAVIRRPRPPRRAARSARLR